MQIGFILENIADIGVVLPPFLMRIVANLKSQVESKADQAIPAEAAQNLLGEVVSTPADSTQQAAATAVENNTAPNPPTGGTTVQ